jgi:hypothetical protein
MTHDVTEVAIFDWFTEFAALELLDLNEAGWKKLNQEILDALAGDATEVWFNRSAVGEAQQTVKRLLNALAVVNRRILAGETQDGPMPAAVESIRSGVLQVYVQADGRMQGRLRTGELSTLAALTLSDILRSSNLRTHLLTCDNRDCKKFFVSKRKPRADRDAHYCTPACCHLESTRRLREQPEYREREQKRSRARYRKKVLKK